MSPERDPVRVVTGEGKTRGNRLVSAGVSGREKDLASVAPLKPGAYDAVNIVPPCDVEDVVGVIRIACDGAGVDGPLGAKARIQHGGVPLYRPKVQGMEAVSFFRGEDKVPPLLSQVVVSQAEEGGVVTVDFFVRKRGG